MNESSKKTVKVVAVGAGALALLYFFSRKSPDEPVFPFLPSGNGAFNSTEEGGATPNVFNYNFAAPDTDNGFIGDSDALAAAPLSSKKTGEPVNASGFVVSGTGGSRTGSYSSPQTTLGGSNPVLFNTSGQAIASAVPLTSSGGGGSVGFTSGSGATGSTPVHTPSSKKAEAAEAPAPAPRLPSLNPFRRWFS